MKKKFNLYCVMFILAVVLGSCIDFAVSLKNIKGICAEAITEADKLDTVDDNYVAINVIPTSLVGEPQDSIYNEITKKKESIYFNSIEVHVPKDKYVTSLSNTALSVIGDILAAVGFVGFWIIFFRVIRSVRRGDVFLNSVATYMMKAAIFLLVAYIGGLMGSIAHYNYAKEMIEIANYNIIPEFHFSDSRLYVAFGLMLLSQIIKHGKELKDEQELTI